MLLFAVIDRNYKDQILMLQMWYVCLHIKREYSWQKISKFKFFQLGTLSWHSNWAMFKTETPIGCIIKETWWVLFSFVPLIPKASFFMKGLAETLSQLPIAILIISISTHWLDTLEYFKSGSSMFPYNTLAKINYQLLSDSIWENIWIVSQSSQRKSGCATS